jgi:hypothetical protein
MVVRAIGPPRHQVPQLMPTGNCRTNAWPESEARKQGDQSPETISEWLSGEKCVLGLLMSITVYQECEQKNIIRLEFLWIPVYL